MYAILVYHTIADYEGILPAGINTPIEVFRSHMDYLFRRQYRVVPLDEMVEHIIHGRNFKNKTIGITFDDGYEDHFLNAYPILKGYGFPATIFLTVLCINGYWENQKAEGGKIRGLSRDQIVEMHNEGLIKFGSHGYTHNNLLSANGDEREFEIRDSKAYLEDLLGEDVPFISYPFGACDEEVKRLVRKAGYRAGFSVWSRNPDVYSIPRVPIHTHDGLKGFRFKLSPFYYFTKSMFKFIMFKSI